MMSCGNSSANMAATGTARSAVKPGAVTVTARMRLRSAFVQIDSAVSWVGGV